MDKPMTTSEQARADAFADAETLRLNTYAMDEEMMLQVNLAGAYGSNRYMDAWFNAPVTSAPVVLVSIIEGMGGAPSYARRAARAAFRAVPGLRG